MLRLGVLAAIVAVVVFAAKHQFHLDGERLLATIRNVLPQTPSPSRRRAALPQPAEVPSSPDPAAPPTMTAGISAPAAVAPQPAFAPQRDAPPRARSALVPASYGVYAVADGKLFELESLTGRVPDQRVFMSAIITKPSQAILPDGHVTFVVYRRDVMSSAPDRFAVRVIAQVARALVFSKTGQPHTVKVDDAWAIRNVAFDYSVAPSPDSPEMIVIKPEKDGFVLQPGRYGLIVKGLVYDFTIQGKVTQTSHCLERTEAANGTFYSECRSL
jgi:hypothetical protein